MQKKVILSTAIILIFHCIIFAQEVSKQLIEDALYHADVMTNAELPHHRRKAMEKFNTHFFELLRAENSYMYGFDELKWISKVSPDDKSFRIFTWEVSISEDEYLYFGVLQKPDGKLYELKDDFKNAEDIATEEFSTDNWLGSYYYNIMEVKDNKKEKYYLLFGLNKWNAAENVKLIDVLFFSKEGKPYFGKPVFKRTELDGTHILHNRLLSKYSSDAKVSLNYNPGMGMIITDNLVRRMSRVPGFSETMVPDGSYIAYEYKNEYWNRIDKLENEIMDSAPRPFPVLDKRQDKGIMGDDKTPKVKKSKKK